MSLPAGLENWITYIEALHPQVMELGLERIKKVADRLDLLEFSCPIITIGGTNGKGSCLAFTEAIWMAAGYSVGSYTSPHLLRFSERVHINGQELADQLWCQAFTFIEENRGDQALTFFEFTTLAALWIFQQCPLDLIILEVGLGGRLDAVNIVDADVAIIATIAMDHMDWLGNSREAIAKEKAGIMRANKPVVIGDYDPPAVLFEEAAAYGAHAYVANRDFSAKKTGPDTWEWRSENTCYENLPQPHLPLQNAATAIMAVECLEEKLPVTRQHIEQGLLKASLPGRFQRLKTRVPTIVDVAHNPASTQLLAQRLVEEPIKGKIRAVFAMLADKDIAESIRPLLPLVAHWHIAGLDMPRGASSEMLAQHLQALGVVDYDSHTSVSLAYKAAQQDSFENDCVLVFGSFHTVAGVLGG